MTIIILILKVIGIILLTIIGILLFLILSLLFVPFRYRTKGSFEHKIEMYGKVSWLLHIFTIKFTYEDRSNLVIRIFGIPIYNRNRKEEKRKASKIKKREQRKNHSQKKNILFWNNHTEKHNKNNVNHANKVKKIEYSENNINNTSHKADNTNVNDKIEENISNEINKENQIPNSDKKNYVNDILINKKVKFSSKINTFFIFMKEKILMLWKAFRNIEYTFKRIYDKINAAVQKIHFYKTIWEQPETKRAFQKAKEHIFKILKNIRPRKTKIYVSFGFEDPVTTADILSVYSILFPWIGNSVIVSPDFEEEKEIEAKFDIRGYITVYLIASAVWTYLFDQDIKKLKKCLNKEEF